MEEKSAEAPESKISSDDTKVIYFKETYRHILNKWKGIEVNITPFSIYSSYMRRFRFELECCNIHMMLFIEEENLLLLGTNKNSVIVIDRESFMIIDIVKPDVMQSTLLPLYKLDAQNKLLLIFGRAEPTESSMAITIVNLWDIRKARPSLMGRFVFELGPYYCLDELFVLRQQRLRKENTLELLIFSHSRPLYTFSLKLAGDKIFKIKSKLRSCWSEGAYPKIMKIIGNFVFIWKKKSPFILVYKIINGGSFRLKKLKAFKKKDRYTIHCITPSQSFKNVIFTSGGVQTVTCWNFFSGQALFQIGKDIPLYCGEFFNIETLKIKLQYVDRLALIEMKSGPKPTLLTPEKKNHMVFEILASGLDNEIWWVGTNVYAGDTMLLKKFKFMYLFTKDDEDRVYFEWMNSKDDDDK